MRFVREPFVSGVPQILTDLVASIPNARAVHGMRQKITEKGGSAPNELYVKAEPL